MTDAHLMTNARLADQRNDFNVDQPHITRATVLKLFVIVAAVSFILRIFYAGHLYEDDGLWFTASEELVRGKALYREIYFDKPPGLALVYAFLFWVFGAHVLTIRLFTIAYSVAISAVLYLFGSRLYDKRVGLFAAGLFAVFSTTYTAGHVQGLGTDFLMSLPYTAGAYLLVRSRIRTCGSVRDRSIQAGLSVAGGALAGVAFQINPKGVFDLIFFVGFLIISLWWAARYGKVGYDSEAGKPVRTARSDFNTVRSSLRLLALAVTGFAAGSAPFFGYIVATQSLREYWSYVWDWGARYGSYNSASKIFVRALTRSTDYFVLNNTLLIALLFVLVITARTLIRKGERTPQLDQDYAASFENHHRLLADITLIWWFVSSYAGVILGGRFYSHYFFQVFPPLCLIGSLGLILIRSALKNRDPAFRRGITGIIVIGFAFTIIRFHWRTAILAADVLCGAKSEPTTRWFHERLQREERMVAAAVRDLPDGEGAADLVGLEKIRDGGPRSRETQGPPDYLFVWGYRPEVYYFSGLLPASRYLSTQPLTGVPADVHYSASDCRSILDESATAQAREQLVRDLQETRPKYIVDELGMFNADLSITSYPEMREFLRDYKALGSVGLFRIFSRRDLLKKNLP